MSVQKGGFVRCNHGRVCFDPDESPDCLCSPADFGDIVSHRVRLEVAWESAPGVRGCNLVGEQGRGRDHSFPTNILEGIGKFKDVNLSIL